MKTTRTILSRAALSLSTGERAGVRAGLLLFWLLLAATPTFAAVRHVNLNSPAPAPPYTTWTTAATNIQDAIDVADDGDDIVVTNGVYQTGGRVVSGTVTNRVAVTKPLTLRSVNGPEVTVILGDRVPDTTNGGTVRCAYLTNGAALIGFTLTNGRAYAVQGGGVLCESAGAVVSNCVLRGNEAGEGAGAYGGTLNNCTITGNITFRKGGGTEGGGAIYATLNHCILTSNLAYYGGGAGECTLNNCTLSGNSATRGGGATVSTLNNCTLTENSA
ncbi:MAG TPA: hypothetical protein VGK40_09185, partial [Verrucomicrobiae bacterium]